MTGEFQTFCEQARDMALRLLKRDGMLCPVLIIRLHGQVTKIIPQLMQDAERFSSFQEITRNTLRAIQPRAIVSIAEAWRGVEGSVEIKECVVIEAISHTGERWYFAQNFHRDMTEIVLDEEVDLSQDQGGWPQSPLLDGLFDTIH